MSRFIVTSEKSQDNVGHSILLKFTSYCSTITLLVKKLTKKLLKITQFYKLILKKNR